jgi:translocation and assembly module TamB
MPRRLLFGVVGVLLVILVGIAILPWWLGSAARPIAGRYGVTFGNYERLGYRHFVLHDVQYKRDGVVVTVDRVETATPVLWAWQHLRAGGSALRAGQWSVEVKPRQTPAPTTPMKPSPSGWVPLRGTLQKVAALLNHWAPDATVGPGTVRWPSGELSIQSGRWRADVLEVQAFRWRNVVADAKLVFVPPDDELRLTATSPNFSASAALVSHGAAITGSIGAEQQRAKVDAQFADQGWLPVRAGVQADEFHVSGEQLKIGNLYADVRGHAYVGWQVDHFMADVALKWQPLPGKSAPPLDVVVRGNGDGRTFTIQAINVIIPGVVANLSEPVTIDRTGRITPSAARFWVRADLAQQPWLKAQGNLTGEVRVGSQGAQLPVAEFSCTAANVTVADIALRSAEANGHFEWPRVQLDHLRIAAGEGDELQASGGWDFQSKALANGALKGTVSGKTLARWLPATVTLDRVTIDASASGTMAAIAHTGTVDVTDLRYGKIQPASVHATWHGVGPELDSFSSNIGVADARLSVSGAVDRTSVELRTLKFLEHGELQLQLAQPARIQWAPLAVDSLQLSGPTAAIGASVAWGPSGKVALSVRNFPSQWLAGFTPMPGPPWTVVSFALTGNWANGPMTYSTAGGVAIEAGEGRTITINVAARGDAEGLKIDALHAVESGNDVINATGRIPLTITPGKMPLIAIDAKGSLALDAQTVPNAAFWQQLAALTGVEFRDPVIRAEVDGSWRQPRGKVSFTVTHLAMDPKRFARPLPTIDGLDVALTGNPEGIQLDRFQFNIEGQAVRASGRLPVPQNSWSDASRDPMNFLRRGAQLRVEVPDAQVAMFSRFLPAALAPTGRLQADVRFDRGELSGFLRLHDAASRPLGPLGVLQQVTAEVEFANHRVNLRRVTATAGGEPIVVSGTVELPATGWFGGTSPEPRYDVALQGKNLPFVRQAGLLVRGDLDLKLQTPAAGAPRISGKVVLRDSLFLADVRAFLPHGGGASASRRPPYFSIETSPLDTWVLDIDVSGGRFMRLRTPVFAGVASARFHLGGTLGVPRAVGDATIDEGRVMMPFASFDVRQGAVRLTEEDPFEPTIFLTGTGRHFGYDLTLEISGKASAPDITFRSSPALDSDQVLLMVMTGVPPSNEVNSSMSHRAIQLGAFVGHSVLGSITGSDAGADRLSFTSGEKISREGNETYDIEYELNDRWTLTGEYDEFDEYNVGFKWRVAPKRKPR